MNARTCVTCGGPMPPGKRSDALYCKPDCATEARRQGITRQAHSAAQRGWIVLGVCALLYGVTLSAAFGV